MILVKVHGSDHSETHKVEVFPCVIGRSMHSGVRVEDSSVSARHAEIHQNGGGYLVKDLFSTNGIWRNGERVTEVQLGAFDVLYFGDVQIDFFTQDILARTLGTRLLPHEHGESSRWLTAKVIASLVIAFIVSAFVPFVNQYLWYWPPERLSDLAGRTLTVWGELSAAALVIAIFCKVNIKKFNYHRVLILLSTCVFFAECVSAFMPTVIFNLHNLTGARFLQHLGYGLLAFFLLYKMQRYALAQNQMRHRLWVALGASCLVVFGTELTIDRESGDRPRMENLGVPFGVASAIRHDTDDLLFSLGLTLAASDQERIKSLQRLEAERD